KITEYGYVHGPAARWDCLSCHDKNSKPVKYVTQKPDRDLCFVCHKEQKEEWTPKKYWHGPTATGKCTICHNPHASNNPFWLRKPTWNLCVTCHEERGSGRHVIAGFVFGSTHPTKGRPDPIRPGKELSCASCHNPHASNSKSLFANDGISPGSLCQMCHKK
ncbi:MAG: cytochrome c3 family protein, partial [Nitrospirae bacterium]|nr:cytochrome c3 family protein [Nitrospirota bacterium]